MSSFRVFALGIAEKIVAATFIKTFILITRDENLFRLCIILSILSFSDAGTPNEPDEQH